MFTVMVQRPNGNQDLYEAKELTKEPNGILMQLEGSTVYLAPTGYELAWDAIADHRKKANQEPGQESATVYVMNRHGSTVATYSL